MKSQGYFYYEQYTSFLNSVETLPHLNAQAAFQVDSSVVFREQGDIVPTIIDDHTAYMPRGGDNQTLKKAMIYLHFWQWCINFVQNQLYCNNTIRKSIVGKIKFE